METELVTALTGYLLGDMDRRILSRFVTSFDWDDRSDEALRLRAPFGHLELLLEEVSEGFREEFELRSQAMKLVNAFRSEPSVEYAVCTGQTWLQWETATFGSTETHSQGLRINRTDDPLLSGIDTELAIEQGFHVSQGSETTTSDPDVRATFTPLVVG